jgi:hypothetical protein
MAEDSDKDAGPKDNVDGHADNCSSDESGLGTGDATYERRYRSMYPHQ